MTIEEKILNRYQAVYSRRGIKPIGLVVDENTYRSLHRQDPWDSNFTAARFNYSTGYDTYAGMMVSIVRTREEIITVY